TESSAMAKTTGSLRSRPLAALAATELPGATRRAAVSLPSWHGRPEPRLSPSSSSSPKTWPFPIVGKGGLTALAFISVEAHICSSGRRRRHASIRANSRGERLFLPPLRSALFSDAFAAFQE